LTDPGLETPALQTMFMMTHSLWARLLFFGVIITTVAACDKADIKEIPEYTGPLSESEKIELYYSEIDKVKVKMVADLMYEFKSGDREFPKGIYLEFFDEFGHLESTLRANEAYFFKEENKWRGRGKVEVKNYQEAQQLNTEELFWKPGDKKIFTDKFVTIREEGNIVYGVGLDATQDLSTYDIRDPKGEMEMKEDL
jgi:LPS export ABC transporter protein LptC